MEETLSSHNGGGAFFEARGKLALRRFSAAFRHDRLLLQCRDISLRRTLAANGRQANRTWWPIFVQAVRSTGAQADTRRGGGLFPTL
jgi:hypothetical protein